MNAKSIGSFLRQEREKRRLTRKQLAFRLGIHKETLLLWEKGIKMPASEYLQKLSEHLNVSVGEILAGERIVHRTPELTDQIILDAMDCARAQAEDKIDKVLPGLGAMFLLLPMCFLRENPFVLYHLAGLGLIAAAVFRICRRTKGESVTRKKRRLYIYALLCQTAALALEILPYGAALLFSLGGKEDLQKTFSYFKPATSENLFHTLTGVFSVLLVLLLSICFTRKLGLIRLRGIVMICTVFTLILTIVPGITGDTGFFTATSICISALVLASLTLQAAAMRRGDRGGSR